MLIVADAKTAVTRAAFDRLGTVRYLKTPEITKSVLLEADAVIVRSETRVGPELLEGTPVRFVGTATIGTDHVDLNYLREKKIGFASAPGSNANSVAEYVVAALLEYFHDRSEKLVGKSVGIVGVGNVGSIVARYLRALGLRVLLNDPPLARTTRNRDFLPLDALMAADVVTIHVPLTVDGRDATLRFFDQDRIDGMKRGSLLINTSRGAVIDELALKRALRSGHLGGAILDVWDHEPGIDPDLVGLTVLGTAHIAGFSYDGKLNAGRMLYDALSRHFGLDVAWREIPDVPQPSDPSIRLSSSGSSEELLRHAVRHCYDIKADDAALRSAMGTERPAETFRKLRAAYRVRREFSNYTITYGSPDPPLLRLLTTLGFRIS